MPKSISVVAVRSSSLALAAVLLGTTLAVAPASAEDDADHDHEYTHVHDAPWPLDWPEAGMENREVSAEVVVYDMYFPIQGGSEYSDNFGDCRGGPSCPRRHEGIDILEPKGTAVLAVASGTVGWMHDEQGGNCCAFELNHDDGWESWYIHLNNDTPGTDDGQGWGFAPGVEPGARIEAGQLVGWVGDSGNAESSPPHLHFELHKPGGVVINPYDSLQAATVLNAPLGHGATNGCDFNDDGYDDLAIGSPGEDLANNAKADAGAVTVLYGSATGLNTGGAQLITQGTPGVDNSAAANDEFGYVTACGDINNDDYDDLVIGVPGETVGGKADAGAINLVFGSANGLQASGDNYWHQARAGLSTPAEAGDRFGSALAVGDFDEDGYDDVAIGVPGEDRAGTADTGLVAVLYGSGSGFDGTAGSFTEATAGMAGSAEQGDGFGASLAAGDFDHDGKFDLAVGIPGEDSPTKVDSGAVAVMYGAAAGLSATGSDRFTQNSAGVPGVAVGNEWFGKALVAADFDNDDRDDLAVGVPGDKAAGVAAGGVNVLYGANSGLVTGGSQLFNQDSGGIGGDSAPDDKFGLALTTGDYDGDGTQDLAVGAPREDLGALVDAGAVTLIYGSGNGLRAAGNQMWSQDTDGVLGVAEENDRFGRWLTTGDFAGIGISSLVVGVPLEDVGPAGIDAGLVHVIKGKAGTGLIPNGDQRWSQSDSGVPGANEAGDGFGRVGSVPSV